MLMIFSHYNDKQTCRFKFVQGIIIDLLVTVTCGSNFKSVIAERMLRINFMDTSCE